MSNLQIFLKLQLLANPIATKILQYFGFRRARVAKLPDGDQIVFIKMGDSAFYLELFKAKGISCSLPL